MNQNLIGVGNDIIKKKNDFSDEKLNGLQSFLEYFLLVEKQI